MRVRSLGLTPRRLLLRTSLLIATSFLLLVYGTLYLTSLPLYPPADSPSHIRESPYAHRRWPLYDVANPTTPKEWQRRADAVREGFLHAYRGYEKYALPHDELRPLTNRSIDNFSGWGVTLYDSLDTLLLMNATDEYTRALRVVHNATFDLPTVLNETRRPKIPYAPFFETVIRYLGGLLSAHALSGEEILLQKAEELAEKLAPVFDTPSRLPRFGVNTVSGEVTPSMAGILAEVASCQLEYTYLGKASGKKEHVDRSTKIMDVLEQVDISVLGMLPKRFDLESGKPLDDVLSVGAAADSGHEYLLKLYLLTAKTDQSALDLYIRTTTTILTTLLYITPHRKLLYATDVAHTLTRKPLPSQRFEHLSCFLPGLLALGVHTLPDSAFRLPPSFFHSPSTNNSTGTSIHPLEEELKHHTLKELHTLAAQGLAETCWLLYADQPTGLGPDEARMRQGITWLEDVRRWRAAGADAGAGVRVEKGGDGGGERGPKTAGEWDGKEGEVPGTGEKEPIWDKDAGLNSRDYVVRRGAYLLRPETVESIYIMYKTTGDVRWRERGWAIFEALERETRSGAGYASLTDVALPQPVGPRKDEMPSYFLAETLKYLYLLFREDDPVPLDRWVFNTEAHPLPVFEWTKEERVKFGLS